jgi:MFS family permease
MTEKHDPFAVLKIKEFNFFLFNRFFLTFGIQMQSVIVGFQIYALTDNVFTLGLIGIMEAIPFIITSFFSGHIADNFNRRSILLLCTFLFILSTSGLIYLTLESVHILENYGIYPIFILIGITGIIRGFLSAAFPSFMAQLIPRKHYGNASTWNSTAWHVASVLGPATAGFLIAINYTTAYTIDLMCIALSFLSIAMIKSKPLPIKEKVESIKESLAVGIKFVFSNQKVLGALSLDLFAVLFGGAVAMLPAIAKDVLHVGAVELGYLRAAPAIGAVIMALLLAYKPINRNAGRNLFLSVGAFGVATILFGLSTNLYLSIFFLILTGAFDNVSVVIRHTILQLSTPDHMRGRVSAVNGIFIGSSNEIGAFESGTTARAFGLRPSIVIGGILTVLVVIVIAKLSPQLRKLDMDEIE